MKKITYNIFTVIFITILFTQCNTQKHTMSVAQLDRIAPIPPSTIIDTTRYTYSIPKPTPPKLTDPKDNFEQSFVALKEMLQGTQTADFERAVYLSENPYHNNQYQYATYQKSIDAQVYFIQQLINANDQSDTMNFDAYVGANGKFKLADMRYLPKEKKALYKKAVANWSIFKFITDTVYAHWKQNNQDIIYYHPPFTYVTNDPFGKKNWSNTQVVNLLFSEQQKGNCFSLTALYKILANRLGSDARICTAPQHSYIQHRDNKGDYYNIELATAGFPRDGTIQTLTHTTSTAIKSGIALRDYTEQQSIGLCLVNLAKSYEHYYETKDDDFLLKCAETVLLTDSLNLSALLLKQQVLDERVTKYATQKNISNVALLQQDKNIQQTLTDLQTHLQSLYRLGYRQMPVDMQQIIMSGNYPENGFADKNASPFTTIYPKDVESTTYQSLSGGLFQEVYDTKPIELYGHFVFDTKTKQLKAIDTKAQDNFLIDPVAFAYDFGARMYDARLGKFLSTDPREADFPYASPYHFAANNPIYFIDEGGEGAMPAWLSWFLKLIGIGPKATPADEEEARMQEGFRKGLRIGAQDMQKRADKMEDRAGYIPFVGGYFKMTRGLMGQEKVDASKTGTGMAMILFDAAGGEFIKGVSSYGKQILGEVGVKLGEYSKKLAANTIEDAIKNAKGEYLTWTNKAGKIGEKIDHLTKVEDALTGLQKQINKLKTGIKQGHFQDEAKKSVQEFIDTLQKQHDEIKTTIDKAKTGK